MRTRKGKVLIKVIVWLTAEILLTFLGIDNLADYSEFIFERQLLVMINI